MKKTSPWLLLGLSVFLGLQSTADAMIQEGVESEPMGSAVQESETCALCHSNSPNANAMRDSQGHGIAPYDLWSGTMMANAARDPLWRAVVSAEIAATPSAQEEIERTCLRCHAPMADAVGLDDHGTGSLMHVLDCDARIGDLARDGVSCTICHGMTSEGLGSEASFGAKFKLDDERRLFGPHESPFTMPMRHHTEFVPTYGEQITKSSHCGSCHTLETDALHPDGKPTGAKLLEQAPYLEWRNSAFNDERSNPGAMAASCQDCHAPTFDASGKAIETRIARNPGGRDFPPIKARKPYGRHAFVGGNRLVLSMLRDNRDELRVTASEQSIQKAIDATTIMLEEHSAAVSITDLASAEDRLSFDVHVENHAGHKLPTAHPTRRAWLRVIVRDESNAVVFASGAFDSQGRILGPNGKPLPSELVGGPIKLHRNVVNSADQVAIYQAVMADSKGAPTHILMRGVKWLMDSRLLPKGWNSLAPDAERINPVGVDHDPNFAAGGDSVHFELKLQSTQKLTVEAALFYQPLGARWAAELLDYDTPEVNRFRRLYEQAELAPELLASATSTL